MNRRPLWKVTVRTSEEAGDATAALLERIFAQNPSTYTDAETRATFAGVYLPNRMQPAQRSDLRSGLAFLADCGLDLGATSVRCSRVPATDWSESWKKFFKIIEIGPALLIKPSWSKRRPRKKQAVVVLDPGLSFGTGQHPTTSFCLKQLVALRHSGAAESFLDIGTGSGILAIAAAKLGFAPVRAFDFDPVAVPVALGNARRNRVDHRVVIRRQDLTRLPLESRTKYDLVCANLTDDLLVAEGAKIVHRLKPAGQLVLAGILASQFARVRQIFEGHGLRLIRSCVEREWQSGAFVVARGRD